MTLQDLHLGTDIVEITRLRGSLERHGMAFFERILTPDELAYCRQDHIQGRHDDSLFLNRAAGRIAVKEAVSKALGLGVSGLGYSDGLPWRNIEVVSVPKKQPNLKLTGKAHEAAKSAGVTHWRISLSHDGGYAVATAIGLVTA